MLQMCFLFILLKNIAIEIAMSSFSGPDFSNIENNTDTSVVTDPASNANDFWIFVLPVFALLVLFFGINYFLTSISIQTILIINFFKLFLLEFFYKDCLQMSIPTSIRN